MKIGFAATYGYSTIMDAIKFGKKSGFNGVEINLNIPEFYPDRYNCYEREDIIKMSQDTDMLLTFHAPEDISLCSMQKSVVGSSLEILKKSIEFAQSLKGSRLTFHIGDSVNFTMFDGSVPMEDHYRDDYIAILNDSLDKLCSFSGSSLLLCAENTGYFSDAKMCSIKGKLGKGLFLTWDLGHAYLKKNQMGFMLDNIGYVRNAHLHDVIDKKDHCIIGTGNVDFLHYVPMLDKCNVSFIIEVRPGDAAAESLVNLNHMLGRR